MYYKPKELTDNGDQVWVNSDYDTQQYSTLDLLLNPLRKPHALGLKEKKRRKNNLI